jgi:TonB family protein
MSLLTVSNLIAWSAQAGLLIVVALLTLRVLRLDAPAVRYRLLRLVLAACLVLPFVQPHRAAPVEEGKARTAMTVTAVNVAPTQGREGAFVPALGAAWTMALAMFLAGGVWARLIWIGAGIARLRRLRGIGQPAGPHAEHEELQALIGARASIRYVAGLAQPVTFGFRRPMILLPATIEEQPLPIQRAVVAHELWHVRRKDWIWTVAEEVLRALFWFHPALWVLLSKIQFAREELVDELTILSTGSRRSYLDALLAFADRPPLPAATAFARRRHLVHRIVLISKEAVMSARRVVACGAVFVLATGVTGWYAVQAFPLVQHAPSADLQAAVQGPGPLERRAKPVTPENPVPRRTYSVAADDPAEADAIGAHGTVTVRLTLDEAGRIAESRLVGLSINLGGKGHVRLAEVSAENLEAVMRGEVRLTPGAPAISLRPVIEASIQSALRAVKQWQYAPPADGPLAFDVGVPVGAPPPPPPPPPLPAPGAARRMPPPPPPAPPPGGGGTAGSAISEGALRVGGTIKPPTKIRNVNPTYPPDALASRVQGVVIIEARIEGDGTVSQARVLRSIPMLDEAALEAVRQWLFTPTFLNGAPVPVIMTVTVNFTLSK